LPVIRDNLDLTKRDIGNAGMLHRFGR
jgi:hypothetical protein